MTMIVPTGGTVGVDPADALLIAPNGTTSSTLYLAQGSPVVVAALPAALIAELDAAAGLTGPDTLFTTPFTASGWPSPVYVAGAAAKRVQASGTLGSMVTFAQGAMQVTAPAVDRDAMIALINACAVPAGGASPAPGGAWSPSITNAAGTTATVVDESGSYLRSGVTEAADGDAVAASVVLQVVIDALATMSFTLTDLPAPANTDTESPVLEVTRLAGDANAPYIYAQMTGGDTITITTPDAVTLETTVLISLKMGYLVQVPA